MRVIETTKRTIEVPDSYAEVPRFAKMLAGEEADDLDLMMRAIEEADRRHPDTDVCTFGDVRAAYVLGVIVGASCLVIDSPSFYDTDKLCADAYLFGVHDARQLVEELEREDKEEE